MNKSTCLIIAALIALSGCTTSDPFADTLEARGQSATNLAKDYKRGEKLIAEGKDNIADGRSLIKRGNNRVEKGQDQVRDGEALKVSAKSAYCAQVRSQDPACL